MDNNIIVGPHAKTENMKGGKCAFIIAFGNVGTMLTLSLIGFCIGWKRNKLKEIESRNISNLESHTSTSLSVNTNDTNDYSKVDENDD